MSEATTPADGAALRQAARHRVRHFLADLDDLQRRYPDQYPRMFVRGEGPYLIDDAGRRLLDGASHLGAGSIGHGRGEIGERLGRQAAALEFTALDSGGSHPKVVELAERLAPLVPVEDPIFSFASSGSESIELAFKIARAYHLRRGEPERTVILPRQGSYHGSTYAGTAATGLPQFRVEFGPMPGGYVHTAQPSPGRCGLCDRASGCTLGCVEALEQTIDRLGPERIAAVIGEPVSILQAVKIPRAEYWASVQEVCRRYGILLITDEVVTGFGRTGRLFAAEHWDIRPDIMVMAKGLTAGYAPLGASAVARHVEEAFSAGPLLHFNTFAGHPVASEAALATLDVLEAESLVERGAELEPVLAGALERELGSHPRLIGISVIGMLSGVELDVADYDDPADLVTRLRHALYEHGVIARATAFDGILSVLFLPALVCTEEQLEFAATAMAAAIATVGLDDQRGGSDE
jgi:adenosylmethionine-8-amino-7-oxononanoate aminotransferase